MTRQLPLAVFVVLLALSASAHAKGIVGATACGADGCRDVTARAHDPALLEMGTAAGGPTATAPGFVRLRITIGEGGDAAHGFKLTELYVPARDLLAVREEGGGWVWTTPLPAASATLQRAVDGLRPIPARRLPRAALLADRPPAARPLAATRPAARVANAGAGGGLTAWIVAGGAVLLLTTGFAARRRGRA